MNCTIIEGKDWAHQKGCHPARVVLCRIEKGKGHEFSTHIQADGSVDGYKKYFIHGHYFPELREALDDFEKREVM